MGQRCSWLPLIGAGVGLCLGVLALPARGEAEAPAKLFEDVTEALGLQEMVGYGNRGVSWVDFDQDGYVDIYTLTRLWRNVEGKRFEAVENAPWGVMAIWVDMDNDGYPDAIAWPQGGPGRVYRNLQGKGFEEIKGALPELPLVNSDAMSAGDLNGDGLVDLYIAGFENDVWPPTRIDPDVILINKGNFKFEIAHTRNKGLSTRGITMADYNEDGHLDIYVSNYRLLINQLLMNDGQGQFTDVGKESGTGGDDVMGAFGHTIGSSWGDLDNDGHFDLFVGNFSHAPAYQDRPKFLKNLGPAGEWKFKDMSAGAGLKWKESFASPALGDYDNDGLLDLFFTTVYDGETAVLYRNKGDFKFEEVSGQSGIHSRVTFQGAWADFDNDGHLDLVTRGRLYRNLGKEGHWLHVLLVGKEGVNRQAVGAQVRIKIGEQTITRQVETGTGMNNQNDIRLHFGLGQHDGPVTLEVRWPNGERETYESTVNRIIRIEQGNPTIKDAVAK